MPLPTASADHLAVAVELEEVTILAAPHPWVFIRIELDGTDQRPLAFFLVPVAATATLADDHDGLIPRG